jgi:hypothetical protein
MMCNLADLRRRRAGEIEETRDRLVRLETQLAQIDGVMLQLDSGYKPDKLKPIRPHKARFVNGEITKAALDVVREAPSPPTIVEVAAEVARKLGGYEVAADLKRLQNTVGTILRARSRSGLLRQVERPDGGKGWVSARRDLSFS